MQYAELLSDLFFNLKALYRKNLKLPNASFQQILAISLIENDGIEMSVFSTKLGIDNSTATRLIDGLEKKKWVIRERVESDNRIIKVFLTSTGKKIFKNIERKFEKIGFLIENEVDPDLKGEIIEAGISLNWIVSKQINK